MTLTFPSNPSIGQTTTTGGRTFQWNGKAWDLLGSGLVIPDAPSNSVTYGRRNAAWVDMTSPANLQVRRGTQAEVAAITPLDGEPVWATDSKRLVVGDGTTSGGIQIGGFPVDGTAAGAGSTPPFGNVFASARVEVRGQHGQNPEFVAGNSRGEGAVDLQLRRTTATQIASGNYSAVLGGLGNTASGFASFAVGQSAVASASRSVAISGVADRADMMVHGYPTNLTYQGAVRAQEIAVGLMKLTTNATPAALVDSSSSAALTIPSGVALACTVEVFGVKTSNAADAAHYIRKLVIRNVGGTTQLMGSVTTVGTDYESNADLDVSITADDSTDSLKIEVTGLANTFIRWIAIVRGVELAF